MCIDRIHNCTNYWCTDNTNNEFVRSLITPHIGGAAQVLLVLLMVENEREDKGFEYDVRYDIEYGTGVPLITTHDSV